MQIPSVPPPLVTNALSQDVVAKAVPNFQTSTPLLQTAVTAAPKSEKSNETRSNKDNGKNKKRDNSKEDEDKNNKDGHSVNISV